MEVEESEDYESYHDQSDSGNHYIISRRLRKLITTINCWNYLRIISHFI
jgi:hypothetical protein